MNTPSLHTLVHIGAGSGSQLPYYEELNPARVILIEPLPDQAGYLRQITASLANAEIWELAVSCQHNNQPTTFTEYNLAQASSLHQPDALLQLYPGIKAVQLHQVQTQTPAAMMTQLNLPKNEPHRLVVEANGEETAIVLELMQQGLLQQFEQVQLALPTTALYNSAHAPEQVHQQLQICHFELAEENTDDPDTRTQLWYFNPQAWQLAQQQKENTSLKQQLAQQQQALSARINEQDELISQLQNQLAQEQSKHIAASRHGEALKNQHAELTTQVAEYRNSQSSLQVQLNEAHALHAQQQKELLTLQAQLSTAEQAQKNTQSRLTTAEQAHTEAKTQLTTSEQELAKYKDYFQNRKTQHEAAEQQITELNQQLADANAQLTTLREQLQQQQQSSDKLTNLENKIEQLFAGQAEQLRQNTNALGQHVTKMHASSNRQWQAALAVQHSLSHGELPLQFNDASITPELSQQLISLVLRNNYDLIIEFGSGHSTSLLARALLGKHKPRQDNGQLALQEHKAGMPQSYLPPSEHDLPKRIISFEHNKEFYRQTQQVLQQQGLNEVVELVHSPLVTCRSNPEHLFYDCEHRLKQVASLFQGQEKHILVLVDGPSAEQAQHSRTPALALLLDYLSHHKLDLVLDDYHRESEQHSAEQWRKGLKARQLEFSETLLTNEKTALLFIVNH